MYAVHQENSSLSCILMNTRGDPEAVFFPPHRPTKSDSYFGNCRIHMLIEYTVS